MIAVFLAIAIACVITISFIWYLFAKIRKDVQYIKKDVLNILQIAESINKSEVGPEAEPSRKPQSYIALLVRVVHRIYRTFERKKASIKRSEELWKQNRVAHMERLRRYQHSAFAKSKINKR